jgi:hypothetical protein
MATVDPPTGKNDGHSPRQLDRRKSVDGLLQREKPDVPGSEEKAGGKGNDSTVNMKDDEVVGDKSKEDAPPPVSFSQMFR